MPPRLPVAVAVREITPARRCDDFEMVGLRLGVGMAAVAATSAFPVPSALPPHGWGSVGDKLFIHGCEFNRRCNSVLPCDARAPATPRLLRAAALWCARRQGRWALQCLRAGARRY